MMGQQRFQYIQKLCTKVLMAVKCIYYETHHFNFIYLFIDRVLQCGSRGLEFIISLLWDYKHVPPSQDNFTTWRVYSSVVLNAFRFRIQNCLCLTELEPYTHYTAW